MSRLRKMGYGNLSNKLKYSGESFILNLSLLSQESHNVYIAKGEGIISATKTVAGGIGTTSRFGRDVLSVGKGSIKQAVAMVKKIIAGIISMIKQMILDVGNQEKRMIDVIRKLKDLEADVKDHDDTQDGGNNNPRYKNTEKNYEMVTVATMNKAGWNLSAGKIYENEKPNPSDPKFVIGIVARFIGYMGANAENGIDTYFTEMKQPEEMYAALEKIFQEAYTIFNEDPTIKTLAGWNRMTSKLGNDWRAIASKVAGSKYVYHQYSPQNYGKYVAQAFSPAAAFVSTLDGNRESLASSNKRWNHYAKILTPETMYDIPGTEMEKEVNKNIQYLFVLIDYIQRLHITDGLKAKIKKMESLNQRIDVYLKMDKGEIRENRNEMSGRNRIRYGAVNPDGTPIGTETTHSVKYESYLINDLINELEGFGEAVTNGVYSKTDSIKSMQNQNNGFNTRDYEADANMKFNGTVDTSGTTDEKFMKSFTKGDVTVDLQKYGLSYMQAVFTEIGNLTYQEGKFYNLFTKIMCDTAENFIEYVYDNWVEEKEVPETVRNVYKKDNGAQANNTQAPTPEPNKQEPNAGNNK